MKLYKEKAPIGQGSFYLDPSETASESFENYRKTRKKGQARNLRKALPVLLLAVLTLLSGLASLRASTLPQTAEADLVKYVMCELGNEDTKELYQTVNTDEWHFNLQSRSTINFSTEKVDNGYNALLEVFGQDFNEVNSEILGIKLGQGGDRIDAQENRGEGEGEEKKYSYNGGPQVNPFDRFGLAGLNFTSYIGEWKYLVIDACGDGKVYDPKAGMYYEGRQEPRSTWAGIETSKDIRTQQFAMGFGQFYVMSLMNLIANLLFLVTKFIVAFTIVFIKLSFVDLSNTLGLSEIIYGSEDGSTKGLYKELHQNVFMPFALFLFTLAGLWLAWNFIVASRSGGSAVSSFKHLARSVLIFLAAVALYAAPASFLQAPNTLAALGQSVIISVLNQDLVGPGALCSTDQAETGSTNFISGSATLSPESLEKVSENMASAVSCLYWKTFLFEPWAQSQFGTPWYKTFAEETELPLWAPENSETLGNKDNKDVVGNAEVPLGGEKIVNNWAFFALSVNTNAHAPTANHGNLSKESSGISNDWWRIVDATSNYYHEVKEEVVSSRSGNNGSARSNGGSGGGPEDTVHSSAVQYLVTDPEEPKVWVKPSEGLVTSGFGLRAGTVDNNHKGLDLGAQCGTPVLAAADGVVLYVGREAYGGANLLISHGGNLSTMYTHMEYGSFKVKEGDKVTAGQHIANVGTTGASSGCHLHFEVRKGDGGIWTDFSKTIDPSPFLKERGVDLTDPKAGGSGSNTANPSRDSAQSRGGDTVITIADIKDTEPTKVWSEWTGASVWARMGTVLSSILVAIIGVLPTIVPAFMTAIYSIATSMLMLFLPIVSLLGIGTPSMYSAFIGYLSTVLKTILKRWISSFILCLSIIFTTTAIGLMQELGWWQSVLLLTLLSIILMSSRKRLIAMVNNISLGGTSLTGGIDRMAERLGSITKGSGNLAVAGLAGGYTAKRYGGSFRDGLGIGLRNEARNQAYRNHFGRDMLRTYDSLSAQRKGAHAHELNEAMEFCASCSQPIDKTGIQFLARDEDGNFYCESCLSDGNNLPSGIQEVVIDFDTEKDRDTGRPGQMGAGPATVKTEKLSSSFERKAGTQSGETPVNLMRSTLKDSTISDKVASASLADFVADNLSADMISKIEKEIDIEREVRDAAAQGLELPENFRKAAEVEIPEELRKIINVDLTRKAWTREEYWSYLQSAYALAWANWAEQQNSDRSIDKQELVNEVVLRVDSSLNSYRANQGF